MKLIDIVPESILDENIRAVAKALDFQIEKILADMQCVLHLPRLDNLRGKVLDLLAWQFHVDSYEPLFLSDDDKRALIRDSIKQHRLRGTVFAVENALQKISGATTLDEWFDYGGEPGFFRIITTEFRDLATLEAWLRVLGQEKNVRSWLDYVQINSEITGNLYVGTADYSNGNTTIPPYVDNDPINHTSNLYVGMFDFSEGEVTLPTAFEDGLAFSNLYIGMAIYDEGEVTIPTAQVDPDDITNLFIGSADFSNGEITIPAAPDGDRDWDLPTTGDWLTLYFDYPTQEHWRSLTIANPRDDLTQEEIDSVSNFVTEKNLLLNKIGEKPTGLTRAEFVKDFGLGEINKFMHTLAFRKRKK